MSTPSSNMISKNYCPNCGGFDLVKLHRSFIQKRILDAPNKLYCQKCELVLSASDFNNNPAKAIPVFIDGSVAGIAAEREADIDVANSDSSETDHIQETASSEIIDEAVISETYQTNIPVKKKASSAWWLYLGGALMVGGFSYVGYQYMNNHAEPNIKESSLSIGSTPAPEIIEEIDENKPVMAPPLQADVMVESKEVQQTVDLTPSSADILVPKSEVVPARQVEEVVDAPQLVTEVAEKPQEPVVVPKTETELRIVLPFKESESLSESASQSEIRKIIKEDSKDADDLMEKATVEFLKNDLDKLLGN